MFVNATDLQYYSIACYLLYMAHVYGSYYRSATSPTSGGSNLATHSSSSLAIELEVDGEAPTFRLSNTKPSRDSTVDIHATTIERVDSSCQKRRLTKHIQ
jgi:hypothetical protein